jgi:hypothetical protein
MKAKKINAKTKSPKRIQIIIIVEILNEKRDLSK